MRKEHLGFDRWSVLGDDEKQLNRRPLTKEQANAMLKANERTSPVMAPHDGWQLVAKKRLQASGQIYDVGCLVPVEALGKNFQSLLDARHVMWQPPGEPIRVKPRAMPAPAPPLPNPQAVIVPDADPIKSWQKSLAAMVEKFNGDHGRARDRLLVSEAGSKLFRLATRIAAERDSIANRAVGRRIARAL